MTKDSKTKPRLDLNNVNHDLSPLLADLTPAESNNLKKILILASKQLDSENYQQKNHVSVQNSNISVSGNHNVVDHDASPQSQDLPSELIEAVLKLVDFRNSKIVVSFSEYEAGTNSDNLRVSQDAKSEEMVKLNMLCWLVTVAVLTAFVLTGSSLFFDKPFVKDVVQYYITHISVPLITSLIAFLTGFYAGKKTKTRRKPSSNLGKKQRSRSATNLHRK